MYAFHAFFLIHEKGRKRKKNYKTVALMHGHEITDMHSVNLIFSWTIFFNSPYSRK